MCTVCGFKMDTIDIDFREILIYNNKILSFFGLLPYESKSFSSYVFHCIIVALLTGIAFYSTEICLIILDIALVYLIYKKTIIRYLYSRFVIRWIDGSSISKYGI